MGTGSSLGIPVIGCNCDVCNSEDTRNVRDRPSLLMEFNGKTVLFDTSPDFRQQAIRNKLERLDAVLYTHAHADHIFGLDDLRIVIERQQRPLPMYGSSHTLARLRSIFSYAFEAKIWGTFEPRLSPVEIDGGFELFGEKFIPVPVMHENTEVLGFRCGDFAYVTDVSHIPESSLALLEGLDVLVISALRQKPHPKHISLDGIINICEQLSPGQTWLTHISHDLEHGWLEEYCPVGVNPANDGMVLEL